MGPLWQDARDRDWRGGAWSRSLQARLGRVSSYDLLKSAAALTLFVSLTRARGAPPREEPLPSYGASARGRPRSRLARGAWSRSLQARLGRVSSYDLLKSAAALTLFVSLTRARGAPPRVEPPVSYGASARGRPRSRFADGRRVNLICQPYARARRAATGRAACELWGLCARPPAIEIGEGPPR